MQLTGSYTYSHAVVLFLDLKVNNIYRNQRAACPDPPGYNGNKTKNKMLEIYSNFD